MSTSTGFRREFTPTWLSLACLLGGHRPPGLSQPFRYVHLGCGDGVTSSVVAAVHPHAEVWAWSHRLPEVEATRTLRDTAGLENLVVHERPGLPLDLGGDVVDILVIDAVLTAASDAERAEIFGAVTNCLRPGGLVCVAYKTTVGWIELAPVIKVMRHMAQRHTGNPEDLVPSILTMLDQLRKGGARYLTERHVVMEWLDELLLMDPEAVLAEYLLEDLRPLSHAQVAASLQSSGCTFVGSGRLEDDVPGLLPMELSAFIAEAPTPVLREAFRDLALRPRTRLDVFRRGSGAYTAVDHAIAVGNLELEPLPMLPGDDADAELNVDEMTQELTVETNTSARADLIRQVVANGLAHPKVAGGERPTSGPASDRLNAVLRHETQSARLVVLPPIGSAVCVESGG